MYRRLTQGHITHALVACLLFSLAIVYVHIALPSMFNEFAHRDVIVTNIVDRMSEQYGQWLIDFHSEHPVFARRQLTTQTVLFLRDVLDLGIMPAFVLLQALLLFFCGMAVYWVTRALDLKKYWIGSLVAFYTTFPILFAFLPSIWSYDDLWQFLFLLLSFGAIWKQKYIFFIVSFFLALAARESSMILLPGFVFIAWYITKVNGMRVKRIFYRMKKFLLWCVPPVLIYVLYYFWLGDVLGIAGSDVAYVTTERFRHLMYNFQNVQYSVEALVAPILVCGLPVYALYNMLKRNQLPKQHQLIVTAFLISLIINTVIVYVGGNVREMRLFALPLIFLWPMLGYIYSVELRKIQNAVRSVRKQCISVRFAFLLSVFLFNVFAAAVTSFFVYESVGGGPVNWVYQWFLFVAVFVILSQIFLSTISYKES